MIENLIMFPEEGGNLIGFLIWPIFILVMMLYGQRFQGYLALNEIESLHFHKNRRWDIKTKNGFLIMLPSKNIHKKLSIANELILNSGLKEFNKIDLRIKNKIITSYE